MLRKLAGDPAAYRKAGQVWLEGDHLVDAWLLRRGGAEAHCVIGASAWNEPRLRKFAQRCREVAVLSDDLLGTISSLESPAPIGLVVPWRGAEALRAGEPSVVLDRLQDAGNVGTILRSAAAFGITQVVSLTGSAALWSPKVVRAAMGAHFSLHLVEQADAGALDALGVALIATSSHAAEAIDQTALPWPCAWVLGHEGQGVGAGLLERCALTVRIPQPGGEESLNVAAAAAVCLYESARQRAGGAVRA